MPDTYRIFRTGFVHGYADASGNSIADEVLDGFIDRRVAALRGWLDDLDHAPIGIRTAPADWRATLASFISTYQSAAN